MSGAEVGQARTASQKYVEPTGPPQPRRVSPVQLDYRGQPERRHSPQFEQPVLPVIEEQKPAFHLASPTPESRASTAMLSATRSASPSPHLADLGPPPRSLSREVEDVPPDKIGMMPRAEAKEQLQTEFQEVDYGSTAKRAVDATREAEVLAGGAEEAREHHRATVRQPEPMQPMMMQRPQVHTEDEKEAPAAAQEPTREEQLEELLGAGPARAATPVPPRQYIPAGQVHVRALAQERAEADQTGGEKREAKEEEDAPAAIKAQGAGLSGQPVPDVRPKTYAPGPRAP